MLPEPTNTDSPHEERWTDARVERLLGWFFAEEMPPAIRDTASAPGSLPVLAQPRLAKAVQKPAVTAGRWLVPVCASVLLMCGWLLWQTPQSKLTVAAKFLRPPLVEVEAASLPVQVEFVSYRGTAELFEQRTELRWHSHSYFEPASGNWVEWSAPELVIDVEPVAESEPAALPRGL